MWTIPNISKLNSHQSNPSSDTLWFNFWGHTNTMLNIRNLGSYTEQPTITIPSTLRTTIDSVDLSSTSGLVLTGDVIASDSADSQTIFKVLATTDPSLSSSEVVSLMNNPVYSNAVFTGEPSFPSEITIDNQTLPITIDTITDASEDKTPWILVLNYMHKGGTDPALNIRDTTKGFPVLPTNGSLDFDNISIAGTVQDGSVYHPDSWGHTGNALFNKLCIALGASSVAPWNDAGLELRFLAKTNAHGRIIHFNTNSPKMLQDFRIGDAVNASSWDVPYILYNSSYTGGTISTSQYHTAVYVPNSLNSIFGGSGDTAMTNFPMYLGGTGHWGIGAGTRWEVDDIPGNSSRNTYHQIWVRANKSGMSAINNFAVPKVLVPYDSSSYTVVDSTNVNYANVYLYGTDGDILHDDIDKAVVDPNPPTDTYSVSSVFDTNTLSVNMDIQNLSEGSFTDITLGTTTYNGSYNIIKDTNGKNFMEITSAELGTTSPFGISNTGFTIAFVLKVRSTAAIGADHMKITNTYNAAGGLPNAMNIYIRDGGGTTSNGLIAYPFAVHYENHALTENLVSLTDVQTSTYLVYVVSHDFNQTTHTTLKYMNGAGIVRELNLDQFTRSNPTVEISTKFSLFGSNFWFYEMSVINEYLPRSDARYTNLVSTLYNKFHTPTVVLDPRPYLSIPNVYFDNLVDKFLISGASVFSSVADIQTVYPPVVFTNSVDLSDSDAVKNFFETHITPITNNLQYTRYSISVLENIDFTTALTSLADTSSTVAINFTDQYQFVMAAVDVNGNFGINTPVLKTISSTALRANISSTSFTEDTAIALTGEVVPDPDILTSYYTVATTKPNLEFVEVRDIINDETYTNIITAKDVIATTYITESIPKVIDITGTVYPSSTVNYANVYLYATNNTDTTNDDISSSTVLRGKLALTSSSSLVLEHMDTDHLLTTAYPFSYQNNRVQATVSFWVYIPTLPTAEMFGDGKIFQILGSTIGHREFHIINDGAWKFRITSGVYYYAPYDLQANTWYHICTTFDDNTNTLQAYKVYVNNVQLTNVDLSSTAADAPPACYGTSFTFNFGRLDHLLTIYADDLIVYDGVLSASEVGSLYTNNSVPNKTPLAHYTFDQISGDGLTFNNKYAGYNLVSVAPNRIEQVNRFSELTVANPPYLTFVKTYWSRFYNQPVVESSVFSSESDIQISYLPVVFASDVDLSNESSVQTYFQTHGSIDAHVQPSRYQVHLDTLMPSYAITSLSSNTTGTIQQTGAYGIAMMAVDAATNTTIHTIPASISTGLPDNDTYQLWVYMLNPDGVGGNQNNLMAILLYDTLNAWPGSGGITTENGNRLSYTVDYHNNYLGTQIVWNSQLTSNPGNAAFYDNLASETVPVIKLGNIPSSLKSIYITWLRLTYAWDFKFEIRDSSGTNVMTSYEDRTMSIKTGDGDPTTIATALNANHGKFNLNYETITPTFVYASSLETTITQASYNADNELTVAIDVVPSEINDTTYKVLSTTIPNLTPDQVRSMLNNASYTNAISKHTTKYIPESIALTTTNFTSYITVAFDVDYLSENTIKIGNNSDSFIKYNNFTIDWDSEFSVEIEFWQSNANSQHTILNFGSTTASPSNHNDLKTTYYLLVRGDGYLYSNTFSNVDATNYPDAAGNKWVKMRIHYTPTTMYAYINDVLVSTVNTPVYASLSTNVFVGTQLSTSWIRKFGISTTIKNFILNNSIDITGSLVPSSSVNYTTVYVYGTDGDLRFDDIDSNVIDLVSGVSSAPYVQYTNISDVVSGSFTVSGTVYSSVADIVSVKIAVFHPDIDLSNEDSVKSFVNTYGTTINGLVPVRYAVGEFSDLAFTTAFNSLDLSADTTDTIMDSYIYSVAVIATDSQGTVGIKVYSYNVIPLTITQQLRSSNNTLINSIFSGVSRMSVSIQIYINSLTSGAKLFYIDASSSPTAVARQSQIYYGSEDADNYYNVSLRVHYHYLGSQTANTAVLPKNKWTTIGWTINSSGQLTAFIDGTQLGPSATYENASGLNSIQNTNYLETSGIDGMIGNVAFYNIDKPTEFMLNKSNYNFDINDPNLVIGWKNGNLTDTSERLTLTIV